MPAQLLRDSQTSSKYLTKQSSEDVIVWVTLYLEFYLSLSSPSRCGIAPIFQVSCVTGENLDLLYKFLNTVPPLHSHLSQETLEQQPAEFHVDELFNVPEVGIVLGGILKRGVIQVGDKVLVGPTENGGFCKTMVATIRRNRTPCRNVRAGQAATVTVSDNELADFRKVLPVRTYSKACLCTHFATHKKSVHYNVYLWMYTTHTVVTLRLPHCAGHCHLLP